MEGSALSDWMTVAFELGLDEGVSLGILEEEASPEEDGWMPGATDGPLV